MNIVNVNVEEAHHVGTEILKSMEGAFVSRKKIELSQ